MTFIDLLYYTLIFLIILAVFAVFWIVSGYIIFRSVDNKLRRCPNCNRGSAGIIIDTDIEYIGTSIDRTGKDAVKIKSEKVVDHFECKHCGHTWIRSFERKERHPL